MSGTVLADLGPVATEFAAAVAGLLAKRVDHAFLTKLDRCSARFPRDLWKELIALGCLEAATEPDGVSLATAVLAEFGFAGLPSPLLGSLVAALGTRIAGADAGVASAVSAGMSVATAIPARPEACALTLDRLAAPPAVTGGPCLAEWVLDSSLLLVACRDQRGVPALVTVDPSGPGTTVEPALAIDHSATDLVTFEAAPVTEVVIDQLADDQWHALSALAGLLRAAVLAGLSARAVQLTARHVGDRVQFGRKLAQLQAVRLTVADMVTDHTCLADMVTQAATHCDARAVNAERHCRVAAIFGAQAAERILDSASRLHGGTGFIVEHPLHFFYRHVKGEQLRMGGIEELADVAAARLLPGMSSGQWDWLDFE